MKNFKIQKTPTIQSFEAAYFFMVEAAKMIGAGSARIALAGVGAGIGLVFSSLIRSASRNPRMAKQRMGYALLGFARTESVALFTLLVAFLIRYM
jgi:F-type H+-transporting ATPase subunit c